MRPASYLHEETERTEDTESSSEEVVTSSKDKQYVLMTIVSWQPTHLRFKCWMQLLPLAEGYSLQKLRVKAIPPGVTDM
jgi:hypothetical protein